MKIYDKNGYVDIPKLIDSGFPFIFIVGGRGTGKTYGALQEARKRALMGSHFLYLRRMQSQVDLINKPQYSPFKALDRDNGYETVSQSISKYTNGFYADGSPDPIGYTAALSTISNMRGFDASDVDLIIFDEFIPERHERPIKNEASALFNAYETVNRNRELSGGRPCTLLCLANANDLGNPLFLELGLVRTAERMREKGRETWTDNNRGILIVLLNDSPVSAKKNVTAIYRLTAGSEFADMAINNDFGGDRGTVRSIPLKELVPVVTVGEITVYRHKSDGSHYVSTHGTGSPVTFTSGETDLKRFQRAYSWLWIAYMERRIIFEEYLCEILLCKYFNC